MQDLLVRLIDLPDIAGDVSRLKNEGIIIRKPIAPELSMVISWVGENFSLYWQDEVGIAMSNTPCKCFLAQKENEILGFSCFDTTALNYFGPTGVLETYRGKGIGKVLLIKALGALRDMGYVYAIIGGVGPVDYYKRVVNARVIEGSERSIYSNMLKHPIRE